MLSDSDIHFVQQEGEAEATETSRVKQLGTYTVEIKIKGHGQSIRREVRVLPEDAAPAGVDVSALEGKAGESLAEELAAENPIAGGQSSPAIEGLEAQVKQLELEIDEARKTATPPTIGGAGAFGQESGTESAPGARNEGTSGTKGLRR